MKIVAMAAALLMAGGALPAGAQDEIEDIRHRISLNHSGKAVIVSYSPQVDTQLRQTGLGPRESTRCFWETTFSVQRTVTTGGETVGGGQPVAALTRPVHNGVTQRGMRGVHCSALPATDVAAFGGDRSRIERYLAEAAQKDQPALHQELMSLGE